MLRFFKFEGYEIRQKVTSGCPRPEGTALAGIPALQAHTIWCPCPAGTSLVGVPTP
jgi:hypothetical protein